MSNVYILRHTEKLKPQRSESELYNQFTRKIGLSEAGRKRANDLGQLFNDTYDFHYIFTSDYRRAQETAEIVAEYTNSQIVIDDRLAERVLCADGTTEEDIAIKCHEAHRDWTYTALGGESMNTVAERMKIVVEEIRHAHPDECDILIISHSRAMQAYMYHEISDTSLRYRSEGFMIDYGRLFKI